MLLIETTRGWSINYDVPGLVFWSMNRLEEIGREDLDSHGRFPAAASHAFQQGYLDRPLVDEWLDILGQVIARQWPRLTLKSPQFSVNVSHDEDTLSKYDFGFPWATIKRLVTALISRGDEKQFITGIGYWLYGLFSGPHKSDPCNTAVLMGRGATNQYALLVEVFGRCNEFMVWKSLLLVGSVGFDPMLDDRR